MYTNSYWHLMETDWFMVFICYYYYKDMHGLGVMAVAAVA